jgi:hypothetical protein
MKNNSFGEQVDGFTIRVLNEREIRAASGILFMFALLSFLFIVFQKDFTLAKFFVVGFVLDFSIRLFVSPRLAPMLILGRWIVRNQTPEYVGAPQKQFAWKIGFVLSTIMFLLLVIFNTYSVITGIICMICLLFLFFESAFGICLGCLFYRRFYREKALYCPGEICEIKDRTPIQVVSRTQVFILLFFLVVMSLAVIVLSSYFHTMPDNLWEKVGWKK